MRVDNSQPPYSHDTGSLPPEQLQDILQDVKTADECSTYGYYPGQGESPDDLQMGREQRREELQAGLLAIDRVLQLTDSELAQVDVNESVDRAKLRRKKVRVLISLRNCNGMSNDEVKDALLGTFADKSLRPSDVFELKALISIAVIHSSHVEADTMGLAVDRLREAADILLDENPWKNVFQHELQMYGLRRAHTADQLPGSTVGDAARARSTYESQLNAARAETNPRRLWDMLLTFEKALALSEQEIQQAVLHELNRQELRAKKLRVLMDLMDFDVDFDYLRDSVLDTLNDPQLTPVEQSELNAWFSIELARSSGADLEDKQISLTKVDTILSELPETSGQKQTLKAERDRLKQEVEREISESDVPVKAALAAAQGLTTGPAFPGFGKHEHVASVPPVNSVNDDIGAALARGTAPPGAFGSFDDDAAPPPSTPKPPSTPFFERLTDDLL